MKKTATPKKFQTHQFTKENVPQYDQEELDNRQYEMPEMRLVAAVVEQAIDDLLSPRVRTKVLVTNRRRRGLCNLYRYEYRASPESNAAYSWLFNEKTGFDHYCHLLGWDIEWMRKLILQKMERVRSKREISLKRKAA